MLLLNSALYSYIEVAQGQLTQPTSKRYNERDEPKTLCDADLASLRDIDSKVQIKIMGGGVKKGLICPNLDVPVSNFNPKSLHV